MCNEIMQQSQCPCRHSSGWNETSKINLSNQRKRRKKQCKLTRSRCCWKNLHQQHQNSESFLQSVHNPRISLSRMKLALLLIILPIIMSCFLPQTIVQTDCQLVVNHPKNRVAWSTSRERNPIMFSSATLAPYSLPIDEQSIKDQRRSPVHSSKLSEIYAAENIANYSTLPTNQDKQNELLRKLSSTMLLETLLRHPFPTNKSPFPTLPWPTTTSDQQSHQYYHSHFDHDKQRPNGHRRSNNKNQIRTRPIGSGKESKRDRTAPMDVSTTNRSTISTDRIYSLKNDTNYLNGFNQPSDTFNSSSLNYLVDKLLGMKPFEQEKNVPFRRPENRHRSPYDEPSTRYSNPSGNRKRVSPTETNPKDSEITLDMLIKDEYDSRVRPMIKSLIDQHKLSSTTTAKSDNATDKVTRVGPINHKIDELASGIDATTASENQTIKSQAHIYDGNVPTTTPMSSETIFTIDPEDHNTLVSFEDNDDGEDEDEDDVSLSEADVDLGKILFAKNDSKTDKPIGSRTELKKILQNVPPYQLSGSFEMHPVRTSPPKLNIPPPSSPPPNTQATTSMPFVSTADPSIRATTMRSSGKFGEKAAEPSVRGSLVFSDGAIEAERANRRRAQSKLTRVTPYDERYDTRDLNYQSRKPPRPTTMPDRISTLRNQQDSKPGESFLLNQLFSTINPLDLDHKLREQLNRKSPSVTINNNNNHSNPLTYKGYVGKDDYLLSTTVRDWSRPIVGIRENAPPTTIYSLAQTTPAPPTDPPSVPYNYFINQPVTNAQSVPSMVIPTSDPPHITTQQLPAATDSEHDKRKHNSQNELSHQNHPITQHHGNAIQNFTSLPMNNTTTRSLNLDRKYSYQIPDKQLNGNQSSIPVLTRTSTQILGGESELNSRNESTAPNSKLSDEYDQNWSPSKVVRNENSKPFQKRRQQSQSPDNTAATVTINSMNSQSPPKSVSIVGGGFKASNRSHTKILSDSDASSGLETTTQQPPSDTMISSSEKGGHEGDGSLQKNISHGADHHISSNKRHTVKIHPSKPANSSGGGLMGDIDGEQWLNGPVDGRVGDKKIKSNRPTAVTNTIHKKTTKPVESDADYQDESGSEDDSEDSEEPEHQQQKTKVRKQTRDRNRGGVVDMNDDRRVTAKQNKTTRKGSFNENHELAGSEILVTGLDKNLRASDPKRRNGTLSFLGFRQPTRVTETILIDGSEGGGSSMPSTQTSGSSSFGSTIIPNSNFFGESSSENTASDNPTLTINSGAFNGNKNIKHHTLTSEDPYQRSSNTVLSTVQNPISTTPSSPTISPKLQSTTATGQITSTTQEDTAVSPTNTVQHQPTKPTSKTSNDRLAFILIGGSCALSVVCLMLAAMSMRCQDMCDDYRSLRNAERAALKLQKHRAKYTKNHQINRLNHHHGARLSPEIGHSLIDELNNQNNNNNNNSVESEINQMRNSKYLNNSKSIQFNHDPFSKNIDGDLNVWNSAANCQLPVPGYVNKEPVGCRCGNCVSHRWFCQDDMNPGNNNSKQQAWLQQQPYYYMQNQSRLRPLFGAGSSIGTFFPRRHDDHNFLATGGGSSDAQILIDNQPPHTCGVVGADPRGVTRSKSTFHTSKKSRLPANQDVPCDMANFSCDNPEHSHHICHHNHHRYNMATSTSEESKLTLNDSVMHCDNVKCSANHQPNLCLNNRLKLMHSRSNGHGHHHAWKPDSDRRKPSHGHHHHHHSQNQPQLSSSEGSSIAQCTCSRDHQPLINRANNTRHHHRASHKHESRISQQQQQAKRDKAMLIWSTNRDRLI